MPNSIWDYVGNECYGEIRRALICLENTRYLDTFAKTSVSMRRIQWEIFRPTWYNLRTHFLGERINDG